MIEKNSINSDTYALAKSMIHPSVKIMDAYVKNNWLYLQLSSGVRFILKN